MEKCGNTWAGIVAYHSETPAERDLYARHIAGIVRQWRELPQPSPAPSHIAPKN